MGTMIQNVAEGETVFEISNKKEGLTLLDESGAVELFRPLEEELNGSNCTKISIAGYTFGVESALVAKRALMGVQKTLRDVKLVDIVYLLAFDEALKVLSIFSSTLEGCTLRSLTIGYGWLVREHGVRILAPLFKSQKTLENLGLVRCIISKGAARNICTLLPSFQTIKVLHFNGMYTNRMFTELGKYDAAQIVSKMVKKCIALEDFHFSESFICANGPVALAKALGRGSSLKMLNLSCNIFGKAGGVALSKVISGHLGLVDVNLSCMHLEDTGVIAIARSLKGAAPSLRVLRVEGNHITRKAAPALAECLAVKNLLTIFSAPYNELEDDGSVLICKAISEGHEQLKEVDFGGNKMTEIGAKAAAEAVANKPNFCKLSIYGNYISEGGIETVKDVLRKGTKGESVLAGEIWMETYFED